MANLADALELHQLGWQVVPARLKTKTPLSVWKSAQTEVQTGAQVREMFAERERNIFVVTGSVSGVVVLDCDDDTAHAYWQGVLGDVLAATTAASTGRGTHYYFRVPKSEVHRGRNGRGGGDSGAWDLRADGGGVIAPPSVHPSGAVYAWLPGRGIEALQDAPAELWAALDGGESGSSGGGARGAGGAVVSTLAGLLAAPPVEGSRNDWLTAVCGHYAKMIPFRDAYDAVVDTAVRLMEKPLSAAEVAKTAKSVWDLEHAKPLVQAELTEDGGWVTAGAGTLLVQVRQRDAEGAVRMGLAPMLNACLTVRARIMGDDAEGAVDGYDIRIERSGDRGITESVALETEVLGDPRTLTKWLAARGLGGGLPQDVWPRGLTFAERLRRYLDTQDAPVQRYVSALGWHDEAGGFVVPDGVIGAEGKALLGAWRPHPGLHSRIPYEYGVGAGESAGAGAGAECFEAARRVLSEVMTFHHTEVCAVYGAWWAACLVKPQLMARFAQFPVMALEAPSESGKSTGFFPLMLKLSGSHQGEGIFTPAALRDYLASHRNGIVWMDDLDNLERYSEIIRGVTVGATQAKKGNDQTTQKLVKLEAALVLSGEALGLGDQKALLDRVVQLDVPSPVDRVSLVNPSGAPGSQWEDIKRFEREVNLFEHSGTLLWLAAQIIERDGGRALEQAMARAKAQGGKGRFADKMAVVRVGLWMLRQLMAAPEDLSDTQWVEEAVEAWITRQSAEYDSSENALTLSIIPAALAAWGMPRKPSAPDPSRRLAATPVVIGGVRGGAGYDTYGRVWFSPKHLAAWWSTAQHGRVQERVASEGALTDQARRLGLGGQKGVDRRQLQFIDGSGGANYWRLSEELSAKVIARAEGADLGEENESED